MMYRPSSSVVPFLLASPASAVLPFATGAVLVGWRARRGAGAR